MPLDRVGLLIAELFGAELRAAVGIVLLQVGGHDGEIDHVAELGVDGIAGGDVGILLRERLSEELARPVGAVG